MRGMDLGMEQMRGRTDRDGAEVREVSRNKELFKSEILLTDQKKKYLSRRSLPQGVAVTLKKSSRITRGREFLWARANLGKMGKGDDVNRERGACEGAGRRSGMKKM
jgi:hypothetical protein